MTRLRPLPLRTMLHRPHFADAVQSVMPYPAHSSQGRPCTVALALSLCAAGDASPAAPAAPGPYTAGLAAVLRTLARSRANRQLLHPQEWARYEAALASQRYAEKERH